MKYKCIALGVLSAFVFMAAPAQSKPSYAQPSYLKPGASVWFDHDLTAPVEPGHPGQFQLFIGEGYSTGTLSIAVNTKGYVLDLASGSTSASYDLASGRSHVMDIKFTAPEPGRQYINIMATVDSGGRKAFRAYAVPVQVGEQSLNPPSKMSKNMKITPSGERVIRMPAQETINGVRQ